MITHIGVLACARFFPPYNVGEGMINLSTAYFTNQFYGQNHSWHVHVFVLTILCVIHGYIPKLFRVERLWTQYLLHAGRSDRIFRMCMFV
jgi:hypothetical protein